MRRGHSIYEMKKYLEARAEDKSLVRGVLDRLKKQNYLDDARYALECARIYAISRRRGRFRIARDLRARGLPDRHIEAALEAVFAETDEASLVRARLKRRLAQRRGPLDERARASLYRSLLRAGFSSDTIRAELRAVSAVALEELPEPEEPEEL